jgi:alkanesulfonate monooxygenase SsuD/methylene tetrahydromethanopterin reductase-like flavin-dependent oxidoreductase (luciferase family)
MKPATGVLENMKRQYVLGSSDEVIERITQYVSAGVQHFMIYFLDYPSTNSMEAFAKEVIPSL